MILGVMILSVVPMALFIAPAGASLTAAEIIARVAENQDRAQSLRRAYVYHEAVTHPTLMGDRVKEYDSGRTDFSNAALVDDESRDGIGPRLYPLTADEQRHYTFAVAGREKHEGPKIFRLHFEPKRMDDPAENRVWAGDVSFSMENEAFRKNGCTVQCGA